MIWKEADERESDIAQLERLRDAAPSIDKSRIQKQIANLRVGSAGERDAAHFLNREFGASRLIGILHDLRLEHDGEAAQIDHLVVHRYQATAWVLETKNFSGRLTCDEHGDWTVWSRGKPRDIPSPINQARRQCELLRQWLQANDINAIKKIQPVVLISPKSSIDRAKLAADTHVVKSDNFAEWWHRQAAQLSTGTALRMMGKHFLSGMSGQDFDSLGHRLAAAHRPSDYDWRKILALADVNSQIETSNSSSKDVNLANHASFAFFGDGPWTFATSAGEVKISRIPDGRFAVRNDPNSTLIEAVRTSCKGRGQWIPRYRNWLVTGTDIAEVLRDILERSDPR